jgi:general transcription factor IIIA
LHEQRNIEAELKKMQGTDVEDDDPLPKRRRGGEYGRDWMPVCDVGDCDKDFKSVSLLLNTPEDIFP